MHWRRKWQPTPVFLPGESQGQEASWAAVYGVAQSRTRLKQRSSSSMVAIQPGKVLGVLGLKFWGREKRINKREWIGELQIVTSSRKDVRQMMAFNEIWGVCGMLHWRGVTGAEIWQMGGGRWTKAWRQRRRSKEVRAEFFWTSERQFSTWAAHWNFLLFHFLKTFHWSRVDLQRCVSFRCTAKWITYTCTGIHSFSDYFPRYAVTEYWVELPVRYSRLSLVYVIYSCVYMSISGF